MHRIVLWMWITFKPTFVLCSMFESCDICRLRTPWPAPALISTYRPRRGISGCKVLHQKHMVGLLSNKNKGTSRGSFPAPRDRLQDSWRFWRPYRGSPYRDGSLYPWGVWKATRLRNERIPAISQMKFIFVFNVPNKTILLFYLGSFVKT